MEIIMLKVLQIYKPCYLRRRRRFFSGYSGGSLNEISHPTVHCALGFASHFMYASTCWPSVNSTVLPLVFIEPELFCGKVMHSPSMPTFFPRPEEENAWPRWNWRLSTTSRFPFGCRTAFEMPSMNLCLLTSRR